MTKRKRGFLDYETYDPYTEGFGSPRQWRQQFRQTMGFDEATKIVKDGKTTPEAILGVSRGASWPEVQSAFKRRALECHPDRCAVHGLSAEEATEKFKRLMAALTLLQHERGKLR